jgi:AraC-like DNA-binding protein
LAPWKVKRLAQHVERHLDRSLESEELAKVAGLSLFHFSREFRNTFGVPPHRYVIQERIGRAKRLMIGTDRSITEIAAECGLADQAHLTKLFKRFNGETPGVWRRTHKTPHSMNFSPTRRHLRAPTACE